MIRKTFQILVSGLNRVFSVTDELYNTWNKYTICMGSISEIKSIKVPSYCVVVAV